MLPLLVADNAVQRQVKSIDGQIFGRRRSRGKRDRQTRPAAVHNHPAAGGKQMSKRCDTLLRQAGQRLEPRSQRIRTADGEMRDQPLAVPRHLRDVDSGILARRFEDAAAMQNTGNGGQMVI